LGTGTPPRLTYPASQSVSIGGSLTIHALSGPSDDSGVASISVKSRGGYTGGISVDSGTGDVTLTDAHPVGGPFTIVIQIVGIDGVSAETSFALSVGSSIPALTATADTASRVLARSIKIPIADLVGNDSEGAVFDGLPENLTTLHGRVSAAGSVIVYEPPVPDPGADDSFTYRIHDGFGQTALGTVTVKVSTPDGITGNLIIKLGATGELTLRLAGIPGRKYQLQWAPSVSGPWANFESSSIADANGSADWVDSNPDTERYYRAFETP
jgi:hypothetical protein